MGFLSKETFRSVLMQRPCPLEVIYWAAERITVREALHLLSTAGDGTRYLRLGRFGYVEAPPPGQPERRSGATETAAITTEGTPLRLADIWTEPTYAAALEARVVQALDPLRLSTSSQVLLLRTGLPLRTLEAVLYAAEEKGLLQVVPPKGGSGEIMVLRGSGKTTA